MKKGELKKLDQIILTSYEEVVEYVNENKERFNESTVEFMEDVLMSVKGSSNMRISVPNYEEA